jgi:hypothetical protein
MRKAIWVVLLALPLWAQVRTESVQGYEAAAKEALVKFRNPAAASMAAILRAEDIEEWHAVGGAGAILLRSRSKNAAQLLQDLNGRAGVEYAEPNYIGYTADVPDDPRFAELYGLQNTGQVIGGAPGVPGADIGAVAAWDISTGSTANVVAVLDTGIDYTHPDLADNIWTAPKDFTVTIGDREITCAAGTHGFNAINNSCDPMDDNNHGTHVSGTIGALGNNSLGVAGVNWTASIMGLRWIGSGGSTAAHAINAMEFAIQVKAVFAESGAANIRVLSNSWRFFAPSKALLDEIRMRSCSPMTMTCSSSWPPATRIATSNGSRPIRPATSFRTSSPWPLLPIKILAPAFPATARIWSTWGRLEKVCCQPSGAGAMPTWTAPRCPRPMSPARRPWCFRYALWTRPACYGRCWTPWIQSRQWRELRSPAGG